MKHSHTPTVMALLVAGLAQAAEPAPEAPTAAPTVAPGMQLQQALPPRPLPSSPAAVPALPAPPTAASAPAGGTQVALSATELRGNRLIDTATLLQAIGPLDGRRFDAAGLEQLAATVAATYRAQGFPFVQAWLPPQNLAGGRLVIEVLEGRYGRIGISGDDPLARGAQAFLDHALQPGDPLRSQPLERTMLLLDDQPGFSVSPLLKPGESLGEGDLVVRVERRNRVVADVGVDNTGSRHTGEHRLRGAVNFNSPWRFGDQVALAAMVTDEHLWLGSADYALPLGGNGLRLQAGMARTSYQLGGDFKALDASGRADVLSTRLSLPAVRSQATNLLLSAGLQHKRLHDRYEGVDLERDKHSTLAVAGLQFDHKDRLGGGGVSYGSASLTWGRLTLDGAARADDATTARSAGGFGKLNVDVTRIQKLPGAFSAYGRWSGQWARKNLDASEKYGLGGFLGVRAYPMGEASGDRGWLTQLELRYEPGGWTPFVFYDQGRMRLNARPWDDASGEQRRLAGAGVGLRWLHQGWSLESTLAVRTQGGEPTSQHDSGKARLFVVAGYRFD